MSKPILVLLDSNNALYRMFYTKPPRSAGGQRVESADGVLNSVKSLLKMSAIGVPTQLVVSSDAPGKTFRHELSPHYKIERKGMPEELAEQEQLLKDGLSAMGIANIEHIGVEADDTLGMIANFYVNKGYEILIVTTDKDMMQLVNDEIRLYNPVSNTLIDAKAVEAKLGVPPSRVADLLALMGDSIDGIIGLEGVGQKTAAKWLNKYGSLEELVIRCNEIKGKSGDNLRAYHPEILENLKLTTIRSSHLHLTESDIDLLEGIKPDLSQCKGLSSKFGLSISPVEPPSSEKIVVNKKEPEPMQHGLF